MNFLASKLRQLDAYSKPLEDFRVKTLMGGTVTLISTVIIVILIFSELVYFLQNDIHEELFVDTSSEAERVKINFDVTFYSLPCPFISVDAMDVSGEHQSDVEHNVWKIALDKHGMPIDNSAQKQEIGSSNTEAGHGQPTTTTPACGSCYGAESALHKCCNTCDDVKAAYMRRGWSVESMDNVQQCQAESWVKEMKQREGEGCRVYGIIQVSKVAGNFHIAPGKSIVENHAHVHDLHGLGPQKFNTSHMIKHFAFGEPYPGKQYPLDNYLSIDLSGGSMFQYYLKTVPTLYVSLNRKEVLTHQFSATKHRKTIVPGRGDGLPGLFVIYEFSPVMVKITETTKSLSHFLTSLCAIVGGVFTVASLFDAFLYNTSRVLKLKAEIGKAS